MQTMQEMLDRWMPTTASIQSSTTSLEPPAAAKLGDVLDREVLVQLGTLRTNGKPELLARTINLYLVESPKLIQKLKQAAAANDVLGIARSAHSLKSSSANVGATMLSRYCGDIEACARRGDTEEARQLLAKIEAEHSRVQSALSDEVQSLAAGQA
jgi:HPt (histidine-containing phosphotransfer) domain-containing protein